MDRLKLLAKKFISPPWWICILLIPLSVVLLVIGLSSRFVRSPLAYFSYLFSSYSLYVVVRNIPRCVRFLDGKFKSLHIVKKLTATKYGQLFVTDTVFRGTAWIYPGLMVNFAYSVFRFITAAVYRSVWFFAIGMYYFALGIVRLVLTHFIRTERKIASDVDKESYEYKCCISGGFLMLFLNVAMIGMMIIMTREHVHYYNYPSYLVYFPVAHAFYAIISSITSYFRYRRYNNPILSTAKTVAVSGALMSLYVAQDALLAAFGSGEAFDYWMGVFTGGVFIVISHVMALTVILKAIYHLYKLHKKGAA